MNDLAQVAHLERVPSPALLVWPDRVQANIDRMVAMVGDVERLRPHVKTHKMREVVRLQMAAGIRRFKAATIAEVEMCLAAGARDVLFAYPLVGPNQERLVKLAAMYREADLQFVVDDAAVLDSVHSLCEAAGVELGVFIDFDCGMGRTGASSLEAVVSVAGAAANSNRLHFCGVHVYDGHVRDEAVEDREASWTEAMSRVDLLIETLRMEGFEIEAVVGGGSPTSVLHAAQRSWQCSPGTTLFWDEGYGTRFPDLPFEPAAAVLTRVISKPGDNRLCLDLGHKAVASEGPLETRVTLFGLEEGKAVQHSEEHLVLEVAERERFAIGDSFIGIPHHICPTVALHQEAFLVRDGEATGETWEVTARNRRITV